jgi:hypothetical protein
LSLIKHNVRNNSKSNILKCNPLYNLIFVFNLYELHYPVLQYPNKVNSLNLDKSPNFSGKLTGIKGQYLMFEDGTVFNVRTFEGYVVKISI